MALAIIPSPTVGFTAYTFAPQAASCGHVTMQDIRAAIRALARRPGFALIAIVTLALGIGGNAAIFSIIDSVLLRPLPYPRADRLVMPWEFSAEVQQRIGFDTLPSSPGDVTDFRTRNTTFAGLAWVRSERFNLTGAGDPERIAGVRVSTDFFDVLGVRAGDRPRPSPPRTCSGTRAVLIGDRLWRRRFDGGSRGSSAAIVSLNGAPATILGVLPAVVPFSRRRRSARPASAFRATSRSGPPTR